MNKTAGAVQLQQMQPTNGRSISNIMGADQAAVIKQNAGNLGALKVKSRNAQRGSRNMGGSGPQGQLPGLQGA